MDNLPRLERILIPVWLLALGLFGVLGSPPGTDENLVLLAPMFCSSCLGAFLVYAILLPRDRAEFTIVSIFGVALEVVLWIWRGAAMNSLGKAMLVGVGLGLAGTLGFVARAVLEPKDRPVCGRLALLAVYIPSLFMLGPFVMAGVERLTPGVLDAYGYRLDANWGGATAFLAAEYLGQNTFLKWASVLVYFSLPAWMAVALVLLAERGGYSDLFKAYVSVTILGAAGYTMLPMVGTQVFFGDAFPGAPPPFESIPKQVEFGYSGPRNCFPSLHTAWILLACCQFKQLGRWGTLLAGFVAVFTLTGTVLAGGHYVLDLFAGFAVALAVLALHTPPCDNNRRTRLAALTFGLGGFFIYWALLRLATETLLAMPALTTATQLSLLIGTLALEHRLALTSSKEPQASP